MQTLHDIISTHIPGAQLDVISLPDTANLKLALLSADYPQHELDSDNTHRLMHEPMYWVFCWASGQVLAQYLLREPNAVRGKTVCDFGTGCGVVAVAAALAGARCVYACDIDPIALQATQHNAALNGVSVNCVSNMDNITEPLDLISVADVLYDSDNLPLLDHFSHYAPQVLLADSRIKNFDHSNYTLLCTEQSHTLPDLDESAEFRSVRIYSGARSRAIV